MGYVDVWQPCNFVVITDRPQLVELAKVWQGARRVARSAATIAIVVGHPEDTRQQDLLMYDLGQATMNIMLAATDLGIGSGHAAVSDQEQARRVLGFPDGYFCGYLIGLGYQPTASYHYSSGRPADPRRGRPLEPVVGGCIAAVGRCQDDHPRQRGEDPPISNLIPA